jgi:hypothetical protein
MNPFKKAIDLSLKAIRAKKKNKNRQVQISRRKTPTWGA